MKPHAPLLLPVLAIITLTLPSLSTELAGKVAKEITVRIEGATQGSGVIVDKKGEKYTVPYCMARVRG